jgi:GAF domain-containing protein
VVQAKAAVARVNLDTRQDKAIRAGDGLVGEAFQWGQPTIVENIKACLDQFKSKDWIRLNGFESFGCFPMIYKDEVVGTLSLYTGYRYEFHPGTKEFLGRVAFLVAAFIGKMIESEVVRDVVNQLDESEQSLDPLTLARARRELNDTFIRSIGPAVDHTTPSILPNPADLIYLD